MSKCAVDCSCLLYNCEESNLHTLWSKPRWYQHDDDWDTQGMLCGMNVHNLVGEREMSASTDSAHQGYQLHVNKNDENLCADNFQQATHNTQLTVT